MAREIKFRAWDKKSKKMRVVDSIGFGAISIYEKGYPVCNMIGHDIINEKAIIIHRDSPHFELMQYTGLKDECGKEIYEGDICKNIVDNHILKVTYWETDGSYMFEDQNENGNGYNLYEFGEVEVIGNIFENPELLEVVS